MKNKTEIEAKIALSKQEYEKIKILLENSNEHSFIECGEVNETNTYYDTKNGKLQKEGQALRIRKCEEDLCDTVYEITHKGKRKKSKYKSRPETEIKTYDDPEGLLLLLGFKKTFVYKKKRLKFTDIYTDIVLDYIHSIGHFIEIEGETEKTVEKAVALLNLQDRKCIMDGYPALIEKSKKKKRR